MLVNDPGLQDSTVFNGRALTYYGRWTYKLEEAARRGALGALLIHTTESATYPWEVVRGSWSVEQFKLDRPAAQSLAFAGWVTAAAVQAALARTGWNLDSLTRAAARRDFPPVATALHAAAHIVSALRRVRSENVAAKLTGREQRLAKQVVPVRDPRGDVPGGGDARIAHCGSRAGRARLVLPVGSFPVRAGRRARAVDPAGQRLRGAARRVG